MNKKLLFAGAVAVAGFFTLTAFDGKTLAQQKEEIAAAVTAQLEMLRTEKTAECDARVQEEANMRVEAWKAEMAAAPAPGKGGVKKSGSKGPKVDPLPNGTKPTDPQKTRGGAVKEGDVEGQKKRGGAINPNSPTAPEEQKKRGGAVKQGGGN